MFQPRVPKTKLSQHRSWWKRAMLLATSGVGTTIIAYTGVQAQTTGDNNIVPSIPIFNQASYEYTDLNGQIFQGQTSETQVDANLIDPLGQILACDGSLLDNYRGFSMALYEPDASGLDLGALIPLSRTEVPDNLGNGIPLGLAPNIENSNPFFLTNTDQGRYNFLLDGTTPLSSPVNAGLNQGDPGAQYILVINPPSDAAYTQRRIGLTILTNTPDPATNTTILSYQAAALDGQPIALDGNTQTTSTLKVNNAALQGLSLFFLSLNTNLCSPNQIAITKAADRAAAQPGDTVVYRLAIRNLTDINLANTVVTDTLPPGFQLISESVFGQVKGQTLAIDTQVNGSVVTFSPLNPLPPRETLDIIYAVRVSPDALRGSGQNTAIVNAQRTDNQFRVQAGPSIHRLIIDPGILSDCATLVGRVFVDKNFDGEQQPGEAGVPNAVIYLDDGNRIITDADGLYSVSCLLPGTRSGVLDLSSLPGYSLAPNLFFKERNSQSRLLRLAPGSSGRMDFAVTPTFNEGEDPSES